MLKQLIVISQDKDELPELLQESLESSGFRPIFCKFDITDVARVKHKSNMFLLFLPEDVEPVEGTLFYIRDTCIEEEKWVYLVGGSSAKQRAAKCIPSMIIKRSFSVITTDTALDDMVIRISRDVPEKRHKHVIYLGDDSEFVTQLRLMISEENELAMVNEGYDEFRLFATDPDFVIVDIDKVYTIKDTLRIIGLLRSLNRKKCKVLFICENKTEGKEAFRFTGVEGVILGKNEINTETLAGFIRK